MAGIYSGIDIFSLRLPVKIGKWENNHEQINWPLLEHKQIWHEARGQKAPSEAKMTSWRDGGPLTCNLHHQTLMYLIN